MFVLTAKITIGKATFKFVNDVVIKKSIHSIEQSAVIKLPLSGVVKSDTGSVKKVNIADQIKSGDNVEIQLGYDGKLKTEFKGQVYRINYKNLLEVECDNVYSIRHNTVAKTWSQITLKDLLNEVLTGVTLYDKMPQITLYNVAYKYKSILWMLEDLRTKYNLSIFFLEDGSLYAGLTYGYSNGNVKLNLRKNVINPDELKWIDAADVKLKIKAIDYTRDGKKIEAEVGDKDGEIRTISLYNVADKASLEKLASAEMEKYKYSGYRGQLTSFLIPQITPCMNADLTDPTFPSRGGSYYVESVETRYGLGGGRRISTLGIKVL